LKFGDIIFDIYYEFFYIITYFSCSFRTNGKFMFDFNKIYRPNEFESTKYGSEEYIAKIK